MYEDNVVWYEDNKDIHPLPGSVVLPAQVHDTFAVESMAPFSPDSLEPTKLDSSELVGQVGSVGLRAMMMHGVDFSSPVGKRRRPTTQE